MSMSDPISDMITRIRNASRVRHATVSVPMSKLKKEIALVLKKEGFIEDVQEEGEGKEGLLSLTLKYEKNRSGVIRGLSRVSKPGGRRYVSKEDVFSVASGYGVLIMTTSKGVMTGFEAKRLGIGGEPLVSVW